MIRFDRDDDIWTVTLDRPEKANALTREMIGRLVEIAEGASRAGCLILTGTGTVFSGGGDLAEVRAGLSKDAGWERLSASIAALPGLTIAALNGTLAGGAFGMALACDLRVAVPGASFFYPVMRLGYRPPPSDPARLSALVGPARAKLILLAGARIGADEALRIGLIDRISDDPVAEARRLAADALAARPEHRAAIKALIPAKR